jgi:hypothetical protein
MRKKSASIRRRLTASLMTASITLSGLIASGCDRESESNHTNGRARQVIQNIGSDTMVNLAQAWAEEYAAVEPAISVEVSGGGTGTGVAALINGTRAIEDLMSRLKGRYTILIVTHNMAQARRASDECVFMLLGEVIEHRPTEDLFSNPHNAKTAEYIEGRFG